MHLRSGLGPYHVIHRRLFSAQRRVELRIVSEYKTVSTSAVLVLVSVPPIDLLAKERQETFQLRKELTCVTNQQVIIRAKKAICNEGRLRLIKTWQSRWHGEQTGRWTYHLIPELTTWLHRTAFPLWLMRNIHPLPARSGAWQGRPLIEGWVLSSLLTQWLLTCSSLKLSGSTLSNHIRDEEEEAQQQRGGGAVKSHCGLHPRSRVPEGAACFFGVEKNLYALLAGAAPGFAEQTCGRESRANG